MHHPFRVVRRMKAASVCAASVTHARPPGGTCFSVALTFASSWAESLPATQTAIAAGQAGRENSENLPFHDNFLNELDKISIRGIAGCSRTGDCSSFFVIPMAGSSVPFS